MNRTFIVDRIEGNTIVLQEKNGKIVIVKKHEIKGMLLEGDILIVKGDFYIPSKRKTQKRKNKISNLVEGMFKND